MEIQKLNDEKLLSEIHSLVQKERKIGILILRFICEIEKRKSYADLGYASLFLYLTKELSFSESEAYTRIQAAKLLKEFPILEEKIVSGKLTTTNLTLIACTLKKNNIEDKQQKLTIISANENRSKVEVQKNLFTLFGNNSPQKETTKQVGINEVRISVTISDQLLQKMNRLKSLKNRSKILSNQELLEILVDDALEKETKKLEPKISLKPEKGSEQKKVQPTTRYISSKVKNAVWLRARGRCEFHGCKSTNYLQYDHQTPFSLGGENSITNLRLFCSAHNLREGIHKFGLEKMQRR